MLPLFYIIIKNKEGDKMCEYVLQDGKDLRCKLNDRPCIYRRYCNKVDAFIHLDEWSECYLRNEQLKRNIPSGSCYVRFERNGYLYVEYEDNVIKIKNTLDGEKVENFVYVKKYRGEYKLSLTPFVEESTVIEAVEDKPKKTTRKRKSTKKTNNEND